jgi:hypothetical protein
VPVFYRLHASGALIHIKDGGVPAARSGKGRGTPDIAVSVIPVL